MYVMRELTELSYPNIAREFGGRDHTTVIHAVEKIGALMSKERRQIYDQVTRLMKAVRQGRLTRARRRGGQGGGPAVDGGLPAVDGRCAVPTPCRARTPAAVGAWGCSGDGHRASEQDRRPLVHNPQALLLPLVG